MQMTDEAKEVRREYMREYMREWRAKPENRKKEKQYRVNFWNRKAEEMEE